MYLPEKMIMAYFVFICFSIRLIRIYAHVRDIKIIAFI